MFINPATISIYVGLLIFFLPVNRFLPSVVISSVDMLKALVAPLSMMLVGFHMASADFKGVFKDWDIWRCILLRLFVCPAAIFALMKLADVTGIYSNAVAATVVLLCSATPSATSVNIFAEKFDCDTRTSGKIGPISTICALASMPITALLLKLI